MSEVFPWSERIVPMSTIAADFKLSAEMLSMFARLEERSKGSIEASIKMNKSSWYGFACLIFSSILFSFKMDKTTAGLPIVPDWGSSVT